MKRIIAACITVFLILLVCACGKKQKQYELFATENADVCVSSSVMGIKSTLTLDEKGTGELDYAGQKTSFDSWTIENNVITASGEGKTLSGTVDGAILKMDFGEGVYGYYAVPGTDTSSVNVMSEEEFEQYVQMVNAGMPEGYLNEMTENGKGLAEKYGLKSDDKHFVAQMDGVLLSYDISDGKITGCTGYYEVADAATAKLAVENYSNSDPTIDSVKAEENVIVIFYTEEAYKDISLKELEESLESFKITE